MDNRKANQDRQEAAKAWIASAQAASTQAMSDNNRDAWNAAQTDMRRAEEEWDAACKASHNMQ